MSFAVVIPSKNIGNLSACLQAIRTHEPGANVFVVDDGLGAVARREGLHIVPGVKPFVWARNINLGIAAARSRARYSGYILLNDDALLRQHHLIGDHLRLMGSFSTLVEAADCHPSFGVVSAAILGLAAAAEQKPVAYPVMKEQFPQTWDLLSIREIRHHMLAFVCVFLPSSIYEAVGPLDERFTEYGFDDDDYCQRIKDAGFKLGVFDGCVVEHGSLPSTFRSRPGTSLEPNRRKFIEKWGHAPGHTAAAVRA